MGKIVASLSAGIRNAALAVLRNPRCGRMLSFVRGLSLPQRLRALVKYKQGERERQAAEIDAMAEAVVQEVLRNPIKVPALAPGLTMAQRMALLEKDRQEKRLDEESAMVEAVVQEVLKKPIEVPAFARRGLTMAQRMTLLEKYKRERQQRHLD